MTSKKRAREVVNYYNEYGLEQTMDAFNIKRKTIQRYFSTLNIPFEDNGEISVKVIEEETGVKLNKTIQSIIARYTPTELLALAKGARIQAGMPKIPMIDFTGSNIKIGIITDTHIGSIYFDEDILYKAFEVFENEGVEFIVHAGDVTEGMSNRPGHVYELSNIGYNAQKNKAIELFSAAPVDVYAIDGNHDRWFEKSSGALIVCDIADALDNFHFIGHDEGDINLSDKAVLKLWHGGDGNSYAKSYRLQKVIESFSGGQKPNILIAGHTHKAIYMQERNVHTISAGCIQRQSSWMRGKRIAADVGFWISDITLNDNGVARIRNEWFPIY